MNFTQKDYSLKSVWFTEYYTNPWNNGVLDKLLNFWSNSNLISMKLCGFSKMFILWKLFFLPGSVQIHLAILFLNKF